LDLSATINNTKILGNAAGRDPAGPNTQKTKGFCGNWPQVRHNALTQINASAQPMA